MRAISKVGAVAVVCGFAAVSACGDDDVGPVETDGGPDSAVSSGGRSGGTGGRSSTGTGGQTSDVECGGKMCEVPEPMMGMGMGFGMGAPTACCTEDDECGLQTPLSTACIAPDLPGGIDPSCEGVSTGFATLPGCCGPDGCGSFVSLGGSVSCVPNEVLGGEASDCDYDPMNDCSALVEVPCDGAEDCPDGQQCCGRVEGTTYVSFGCYDSCAEAGTEADAGMGTLFLEMCHPGDTCSVAGYTCGTSQYLAPFLTRCYMTAGELEGKTSNEADEVNCGDATCGDGEKCCIRTPHEPYCAPTNEDCACAAANEDCACAAGAPGADAGPEAGVLDAGADAKPPEGGAPEAAAPEASIEAAAPEASIEAAIPEASPEAAADASGD